MTTSGRLRAIALAWTCAVLLGCSGDGAGAHAVSAPSPLWKTAHALATLDNERIEEADADEFWKTNPNAALPGAVAEALTLPKADTKLQAVRSTGRSFMINGIPVALYARSWRVGGLRSVSLVSYVVTRHRERVAWSELFVLPQADRERLDALEGMFKDGAYRFIAFENDKASVMTPEAFSTKYLDEAPDETTQALTASACSYSESTCNFAWSLRLDLVVADACGVGADDAGLIAGATCFSWGGPIGGAICGSIAAIGTYTLCAIGSSGATGALASTICKVDVLCLPGTQCGPCPFRSVCTAVQTLETGACASVASLGLCSLLAKVGSTGTDRFLKSLSSELDGDFFKAVCDIDTGDFLEDKCKEHLGLMCMDTKTGMDAGGPKDAAVPSGDSDAIDASACDAGDTGCMPESEGGTPSGSRQTMASTQGVTCVVLQDGSAPCFQFGGGTVDVTPGVSNATMIARGSMAFAVGLADGTIEGTTGNYYPPGMLYSTGISHAVSVAATASTVCAALEDGSVSCWPGNGGARITKVDGISNAVMVSGRDTHFCALLADGKVACWGDNSQGQLGVAQTVSSGAVVVANLSGVVDVSAVDSVTCAVLDDGTVACWGAPNIIPNGGGAVPAKIAGIEGATRVAASSYRGCAIVGGGTVRCWGKGPLGDGTASDSATPVVVEGISAATELTVGTTHTCARLFDGTVTCWGCYGASGSAGGGCSNTPQKAAGISGVR